MTTRERKAMGIDADMPILDDSDVIVYDPENVYDEDYDEEE